MEQKENPIFGRKVFFLYPSLVMENYLIDFLMKAEYEVYKLSDYRKAKGILLKNPNAMLFVNIDAEMSYSEWYNFMKSFSFNPDLESIQLGVVSELAGWEDKDKFLMNVNLPGGFTMIEKSEKVIREFTDILDNNGARGRRKYLRLDTRNERDVSGYFAHKDRLYAINVKDISSAGFAITYKQEIAPLFQKNTLVRNLSISAGRKSMVCSCIVFNTQVNPDGTAMSVLMLTNENPESFRIFIRNYIFEKYNQAMQKLIDEIKKDLTPYNNSDDYKQLKAVANRNYDEEKLPGPDELPG